MNQTQKTIAGLIATFEVVLLFIMGVVGNKISDSLSIPINTLLIITSVVLGLLAIISYFKLNPSQFSIPTANKFIPKSMVGIFPFGIFLGLIVGLFIEPLNPQNSFLLMPGWIANIFGFNSLELTRGEFFGILGGCIACLIFALFVDGYLGGALLIGFGLSFATATIFLQGASDAADILVTYLGQGFVFTLVSIFLIAAEPIFKRIRKNSTESRT